MRRIITVAVFLVTSNASIALAQVPPAAITAIVPSCGVILTSDFMSPYPYMMTSAELIELVFPEPFKVLLPALFSKGELKLEVYPEMDASWLLRYLTLKDRHNWGPMTRPTVIRKTEVRCYEVTEADGKRTEKEVKCDKHYIIQKRDASADQNIPGFKPIFISGPMFTIGGSFEILSAVR